ncbi:MAG: flagellar biosynthesis anti-sigma factor FlgM [Pseudomonadota bacterium]
MDQNPIGKLGNKVDESVSSSKPAADAGSAASSSPAAPKPGDTVELTSGARLLERLEKTLADLPAIDNARVSEVKAAIESGDYEVDADAVADAMIRFERSFGE